MRERDRRVPRGMKRGVHRELYINSLVNCTGRFLTWDGVFIDLDKESVSFKIEMVVNESRRWGYG